MSTYSTFRLQRRMVSIRARLGTRSATRAFLIREEGVQRRTMSMFQAAVITITCLLGIVVGGMSLMAHLALAVRPIIAAMGIGAILAPARFISLPVAVFRHILMSGDSTARELAGLSVLAVRSRSISAGIDRRMVRSGLLGLLRAADALCALFLVINVVRLSACGFARGAYLPVLVGILRIGIRCIGAARLDVSRATDRASASMLTSSRGTAALQGMVGRANDSITHSALMGMLRALDDPVTAGGVNVQLINRSRADLCITNRAIDAL